MQGQRQASNPELTLYAAWFCPFAQRAWMALLHKGIAFKYVEVDPYRESSWWAEISRGRMKVPVIVSSGNSSTGVTTVIDSIRTLEYLEDLLPDRNPLYPGNANEKAEIRFWVDHINERIVPYMYRFLKAKRPGNYREESKTALTEGLRKLGEAMAPSGKFLTGKQLTAVDIALIPFAYRIDALLSCYRHFRLPTHGEHWRQYKEWYDAMLKVPAFQETATSHHNYRQRLIDFYLPYSVGKGQADVTAVK